MDIGYFTSGKLQAFEALMQETPGSDHYDSGADGILPECRSCRFHRPGWKTKTCVYDVCPYWMEPISTRRPALDDEPER